MGVLHTIGLCVGRRKVASCESRARRVAAWGRLAATMSRRARPSSAATVTLQGKCGMFTSGRARWGVRWWPSPPGRSARHPSPTAAFGLIRRRRRTRGRRGTRSRAWGFPLPSATKRVARAAHPGVRGDSDPRTGRYACVPLPPGSTNESGLTGRGREIEAGAPLEED